ncbi:MAG: hypothetical protein RBU25_15820 [Lentisphaeria bacterium]|jgi:hypothetical protein|nr:hypothetical protein [Lentisphaeria bacterium]
MQHIGLFLGSASEKRRQKDKESQKKKSEQEALLARVRRESSNRDAEPDEGDAHVRRR